VTGARKEVMTFGGSKEKRPADNDEIIFDGLTK